MLRTQSDRSILYAVSLTSIWDCDARLSVEAIRGTLTVREFHRNVFPVRASRVGEPSEVRVAVAAAEVLAGLSVDRDDGIRRG